MQRKIKSFVFSNITMKIYDHAASTKLITLCLKGSRMTNTCKRAGTLLQFIITFKCEQRQND